MPMHTKAKIILCTGLAVLIGGVVFVCLKLISDNKVDVMPVSRGPAVAAVYATGVVEPTHWARVGPVQPGRITAIYVHDGDKVTEGQVLARMEERESAAALEELKAKEIFLRKRYERMRSLLAEESISRQEFDQAESEWLSAKALIDAATQRLRDRELIAPLGGVVLRQDGEVGEVVKPEDTLFWVGSPRPLRVEAEVDEEDIADIRTGQKVLIQAEAFPDLDITGEVSSLTPKGDPVRKTFRVRISVPDEAPLKVGMTVELNIVVTHRTSALLVPTAAVENDHVWVCIDGQARQRQVKIGVTGETNVEIIEGVSDGELVIVSPPEDLQAGQAGSCRPVDNSK